MIDSRAPRRRSVDYYPCFLFSAWLYACFAFDSILYRLGFRHISFIPRVYRSPPTRRPPKWGATDVPSAPPNPRSYGVHTILYLASLPIPSQSQYVFFRGPEAVETNLPNPFTPALPSFFDPGLLCTSGLAQVNPFSSVLSRFSRF